MFKYRINDILLQLPMKDYRKALKVIPKAIDVSLNTFSNYRNIKLTDPQDIPHQKVVLLEKILGLKSGELENFTPEFKPLKELLKECKE
ncbi:hypothetical protein ACFSJU_03415 [Paradesertivirga mongoliensis]|uniref:HTH cro/C1-type domain-containing protein n=1 Tax=Paradesertivirga mongoliensis TaxID=2100740 RepID=A0ABW4ZHR2_9SPHI|nr:hypothetical protein [Pedobacter mongoliensis]